MRHLKLVLTFLAIAGLPLCLLAPRSAWAQAPSLYRQPAYESPLRGDPDDLLLIPGYGLSAADTVVYAAIFNTTQVPAPPSSAPATSTATQGVADLASAVDAPYSLTVHLPAVMTAGQSYALWVQAPGNQWSSPVLINDARPLWMTPDSACHPGQEARAGVPHPYPHSRQPVQGGEQVDQTLPRHGSNGGDQDRQAAGVAVLPDPVD